MKKNNLNKVIKKGAIVIAASLATMSLFGCNSKVEGNKTYTTYPIDQDEQISNGDKIVTKEDKTNLGNEIQQNITISPEEAARGKTVENTKRTVNEYGITIYGKPISEAEVISKGLRSEIGIKNDKKDGVNIAYTEYYSEVQDNIIYLATVIDTGSREYFNKDGVRIGSGSSKSANVDIEKILANVKMGNAMAEAIDRSINKNK